jgi:DNA-binding transcriptional LysR family regulator
MSELITQSHRTIVLDDGTSWYFGAGAKGKPHVRSADWSATINFGSESLDVAMLPTWTGASAPSMPGYAPNVQVKVNRIWHARCKEIVSDITMQQAIDRLVALVAEEKAEKEQAKAAKSKQAGAAM